MCSESKWLIKLFKPFGFEKILIKAFYKTRSGKHVWFDEDLKTCKEDYSMHAYVKLCRWKDDQSFDGAYLAVAKDDKPSIFEVQHKFNNAGILAIPLETFTHEKLDDFSKTMFAQLMIALSNGYELRLGAYGRTILEPHSYMTSIVECDMMV